MMVLHDGTGGGAMRTTGRQDLLDRVRDALAAGVITPGDLAEVIREREPARAPRAGRLAQALGLVVVFLGAALAYATAFRDLPDAGRLTTPFVFPAAAFAAWAVIRVRQRPRWEAEGAAALAVTALAAALTAAWAGSGVPVDRWGVGAAIAGTAVCGLVAWRPEAPYAAGVGVVGGLVAAANFAASVLGAAGPAQFRWLEFGLAAAAAAVGAALLRVDRVRAGIPLAAAALLATSGSALGLAARDTDVTGLTPWHVLLSVTVAVSLVLAGALRIPALMVAGAASGAAWLLFVIPLAGANPGWALLVVLMGVVLVFAGVAGPRLRRPGGHRPLAG
jgi:hypothetical protein